jgi:hypothetical protein
LESESRQSFHDSAYRTDLRPCRVGQIDHHFGGGNLARRSVVQDADQPGTDNLDFEYLHIRGRRQLKVLVDSRQQFRRDFGLRRLLVRLGVRRIDEIAQGDADTHGQHHAGYGDQAPGSQLLSRRPVAQIKRVGRCGTGENALGGTAQWTEPPQFPPRRCRSTGLEARKCDRCEELLDSLSHGPAETLSTR